jgi:hypothetical protein
VRAVFGGRVSSTEIAALDVASIAAEDCVLRLLVRQMSTRMATKNSSAKYSRHGSQPVPRQIPHLSSRRSGLLLRVLLDLQSDQLLAFQDDTERRLYWGSDFEAFVAIRDLPSFERFFPETPFGGEGVEAPTLIGPLYLTLERAGLKGKPRIEEDGPIPLDDKRQKDFWFRIGVERAFMPPLDVLGLAAVREDSKNALEHWVVFVGKNIIVGKNELKNSEIDSWHGVVLDSDRDYLYWRKINDRATPRIEIERSDKTQQKLYWISSFISVSVA